MNWSRVKVILIAIFLLTDIFLAWKTYEAFRGAQISADVIASTRQILHEKEISLKCDIPQKIPRLNWMLFLNEKPDREVFSKIFLDTGDVAGVMTDSGEKFQVGARTLLLGSNGTVSYSENRPGIVKEGMETAAAEKSVRNYLKKYYSNISEFVFDRFEHYTNGDWFFGFVGRYGGSSVIFDNYINVKISSNGDINIESFYIKPLGPTHESRDIIPVNEILLMSFVKDVKNLGKDIVISDIKLGYLAVIDKEDLSRGGVKSGNIQSAPSWRIRTTDGGEYFYNAYNGQRHVKK